MSGIVHTTCPDWIRVFEKLKNEKQHAKVVTLGGEINH